uniref:Uncharacterized protein n=1 Tax=Oryza sativa subsp. japonica TaxID=39947 RepID=Q84ZR4_ORYSJ|nr:hypothetical protein [Oryza sativa Japonica Group]BAD30426.1 hypothetical protein [Oryza sativa Japonica Group]
MIISYWTYKLFSPKEKKKIFGEDSSARRPRKSRETQEDSTTQGLKGAGLPAPDLPRWLCSSQGRAQLTGTVFVSWPAFAPAPPPSPDLIDHSITILRFDPCSISATSMLGSRPRCCRRASTAVILSRCPPARGQTEGDFTRSILVPCMYTDAHNACLCVIRVRPRGGTTADEEASGILICRKRSNEAATAIGDWEGMDGVGGGDDGSDRGEWMVFIHCGFTSCNIMVLRGLRIDHSECSDVTVNWTPTGGLAVAAAEATALPDMTNAERLRVECCWNFRIFLVHAGELDLFHDVRTDC